MMVMMIRPANKLEGDGIFVGFFVSKVLKDVGWEKKCTPVCLCGPKLKHFCFFAVVDSMKS